jgi:hypothetical protein
VLRWRIPDAGGDPYAVCDPPGEVSLPTADLSGLQPAERDQALRAALDAAAVTRFDLANGPLWRARLLRLAADHHVLVIAAHHVVIDGWSQQPFLQDLARAYTAAVAGEDADLEPLQTTFADYVAWRAERERQRMARDLDWWTEHLAGAPTVLELPSDSPRPPVQTFAGAAEHADLDVGTDAELRALARGLQATPSTVLLAAFGELVRRLNGRGDNLVGVPFADRQHAAFHDVVGFLLDIVPLRLRTRDIGTFSENVRTCRDELVDAIAHRDAPLDRLIEALSVERDLSRSPLIQVLFNVYNFPAPSLRLPGVTAQAIPVGLSGSPFDLTVYVTESGARFGLDLVYNPDLFQPERARHLLAGYVALIGGLVAEPDRPVSLVAAPWPAPAAPAAPVPSSPARQASPASLRASVTRRVWPASEMEQVIASVWQELLNRPAIGVTDNFFDLGGNSLAIAALRSRLAEVLGRELTVVDLFRYPNVRALAAFVEGRVSSPGLERAARRVALRRERHRPRPGPPSGWGGH